MATEKSSKGQSKTNLIKQLEEEMTGILKELSKPLPASITIDWIRNYNLLQVRRKTTEFKLTQARLSLPLLGGQIKIFRPNISDPAIRGKYNR